MWKVLEKTLTSSTVYFKLQEVRTTEESAQCIEHEDMTNSWWEILATWIKTKETRSAEWWTQLQRDFGKVLCGAQAHGHELQWERETDRERERECGPLHILPMIVTVVCFLTRGWAGWNVGISRTGPWVLCCLSGASRIIWLQPFHLTQQRRSHRPPLLSLSWEASFKCFHVSATWSVLYF